MGSIHPDLSTSSLNFFDKIGAKSRRNIQNDFIFVGLLWFMTQRSLLASDWSKVFELDQSDGAVVRELHVLI
jgi:hypothetical protein